MKLDFKEELEKRVKEIDKVITRYLPEEAGYQKQIMEAMNYSMLSGGKRIRPMLMLETYRLLEGDSTNVEYFMSAIEMIHAYSLVHDDLPAMDNDEYRRGRKTTHVVFGEGMGILAGDALLNYAFETAARAFDQEETLRQSAKAFQVLGKKAGIYGMIGGQVVDISSEGEALTLDKVKYIHRLKTGALIEASMMIGAILAGAEEEEIEQIEKAAEKIGMAFQIQDDILDVTGTQEMLGKPIHSDEKNQKTTYVTIVGLEEAGKDVEKYSTEALSIIKSFKGKNEFLENLISYLIKRKR